MGKQEIKIMTVAVSILATLIILLAGYTFYNKYIIQDPLLKTIGNMSSVSEAFISKEDNQYQITVELDNIDNLQTEFAELDKIAAAHLGRQEYNLLITNVGNQKMAELFGLLQPFVYEALAKDNYIWLNQEISRMIQEEYSQINYKFFIDDKRVYFQFTDGNETLYKIIPRDLSSNQVKI